MNAKPRANTRHPHACGLNDCGASGEAQIPSCCCRLCGSSVFFCVQSWPVYIESARRVLTLLHRRSHQGAFHGCCTFAPEASGIRAFLTTALSTCACLNGMTMFTAAAHDRVFSRHRCILSSTEC